MCTAVVTTGVTFPPRAVPAKKEPFTVDTLYTRLKNPWGMAWLPDGRALVTERSGQILVFRQDRFTGQKLSGLPAVYQNGQGGLMDIVLHPQYEKNGWVYISMARPAPRGGGTAIIRAKLNGNRLQDIQTIFQARPLSASGAHFGCRMVFDNDGYLYFSIGERGTKPNAQTLANDLGKIHRIHDDGRIPSDNPFAGREGARDPSGPMDTATPRDWLTTPQITGYGPMSTDQKVVTSST